MATVGVAPGGVWRARDAETWRGPLIAAATGVLLVAVAAGAIPSLFGLRVNSFWIDELFTAWVVGTDHSFTAMFDRLLHDSHPPLYYMLVFGWAQLFGASEAGLRSLSLVCSLAALAVFVVGTRAVFSLPARLFAVALALISGHWMFHVHDARSYGLAMVAVSAMLVLAIRLIGRERRGEPAPAAGLFAAMVVATGVHFYGLFVADAVIAVVLLTCPRRRVGLAVFGLVLTVATFAYVHFVVMPHTVWLADHSWFGNDLHWYRSQTQLVTRGIASRTPRLLLAALAIFAVVRRDRSLPGLSEPVGLAGLLCVAVIPLVVVAGIASSLLVSPTYTDRNVLVAVPFAWGVCAFLFDAVLARRGGAWVGLAASLVLLCLTPTALYYTISHTEPYRDTAAWIAGRAGCARATIPVAIDRIQGFRGDWGERLAKANYGYYLPAGIATTPVYVEDLKAGRLPPASGCDVVLWQIHFLTNLRTVQAVQQRLAAGLGRPVTLHRFRSFAGAAAFVYTAPVAPAAPPQLRPAASPPQQRPAASPPQARPVAAASSPARSVTT